VEKEVAPPSEIEIHGIPMGRTLAAGGRLRYFRSPEPNGEAAPAFFGVYPGDRHLHFLEIFYLK
jgi:hypothetical protein